eukprot:546380-Rhodomonas_salina.6
MGLLCYNEQDYHRARGSAAFLPSRCCCLWGLVFMGAAVYRGEMLPCLEARYGGGAAMHGSNAVVYGGGAGAISQHDEA